MKKGRHYAKPAASRPDFPPEYGLLAADQGAGLFPWGHVCERMAEARNYWVCTVRPDGRPHAMPLWGLWVDNTFYFGTGRGTVKARNLAAAPNLVVHLESGDDVVILEGTAEEIKDRRLLKKLTRGYAAKYGMPPPLLDPGNVTYVLRAKVAFAWREKDFPESATRWLLE